LMLSRLEKSFDQMNQFSSDIAHELRNPLNTLMGETELALCGKADAEKLREILVSNMEEYRHLNRLISSLLFISKTERGILNMHKQAIVACEEINAVCELYISKLSQAGISLNIAQNSKEVYVDPTLFKQVINNLLTNAINYTPSGGLITIDIDDGPEGYIRIQIQDNGIGIETTHLSRLCDRFYRVDISRSKDTGGMGLGLAICKSIVELHQGSLSIESQVNQGTTVKLLFPTSA